MCHATMIVAKVCEEFGVDCVVTCGGEQHEPPSKHFYDQALDYRTRDLADRQTREQFLNRVRALLGDGYDALLESDHLHVEWDPKS
jgi:hypothetical protein